MLDLFLTKSMLVFVNVILHVVYFLLVVMITSKLHQKFDNIFVFSILYYTLMELLIYIIKLC